MRRLLALTALLMLTACAAATTEPITPTPTPAVTSSPAPTDTPTTPIPTPVMPFAQVAHSLILSTGSSPDCELPCWHDLWVGVSTEADVQRVFAELLDAQEKFEFFAPPVEHSSHLERLLDIEGTYAGGLNWEVEESELRGSGFYYLHAFMDEDTGLLLGIREIIDSYSVFKAPTLPEALERLGKPDWLYGNRFVNGYAVTLVYEQGVIVSLDIPFKRYVDTSTVLFCFDEQPISGTYWLVDPYVSLGREDWSILQSRWQIPQDPAPYIDERLGMTSIEEFIEFVNSDYPCFDEPYNYGW